MGIGTPFRTLCIALSVAYTDLNYTENQRKEIARVLDSYLCFHLFLYRTLLQKINTQLFLTVTLSNWTGYPVYVLKQKYGSRKASPLPDVFIILYSCSCTTYKSRLTDGKRQSYCCSLHAIFQKMSENGGITMLVVTGFKAGVLKQNCAKAYTGTFLKFCSSKW